MEPLSSHDSPKYGNSLICCSTRPTANSTPSSSSTSGCVSAEESYDSSITPKSLANGKLKIQSNASVEEIETAIVKYKELIFGTAPASDERKWLVRYLVELRLRLEELKENDGLPKDGVSIKGHHFKPQTAPSNRKQYCDHCSGVIWSIVQGSYICSNCDYICHYKCVDNILRVCAHVVMTEAGALDMNICPEIGLAAQDYKCQECQTPLTFTDSWNEPRLCDYTGHYFCSTCHWNDTAATPARVIHNWDWEKRPVSRLAYQLLALAFNRPLIDIESTNSTLFNFIAELEWVHKMRKDLAWIRRYLCACAGGSALLSPLFVQLGDVSKKYSMAHLQAINDGSLETELTELTEKCRSHITSCALCSGKGYICEICGNNEVLYPFDSGAVFCEKCNTLYHRGCWLRKNQKCLKCQRIQERRMIHGEEEPDSLDLDIDKFIN